ncbi:hypothetical protein [Microcoleus sp. POL10_C6]|uniref:hypothetical protein n=1 Tax=unclassified Microcoleus TaxID=2642155 RepID=UPI002FD5465A
MNWYDHDRALFSVCLYTAARIAEACTLRIADAYTPEGEVRSDIIFRKANTKGKLATRCIPVIEDLRVLLVRYHPTPGQPLNNRAGSERTKEFRAVAKVSGSQAGTDQRSCGQSLYVESWQHRNISISRSKARVGNFGGIFFGSNDRVGYEWM